MKDGMRWVLYLGIGVFAFLFFIYTTFPYDKVKYRAVSAIEQNLGGEYEVKVEELEPHWFTGVKLHSIQIFPRKGPAKKPLLEIPTASARAGILSLITGSPKISLNIDFNNGNIGGSVSHIDEVYQVNTSIDDLDLRDFAIIESASGLKLHGNISGDINVQVNPLQLKQMSGVVDLVLSDWLIAKGSVVKLGSMGEIPLEREFVLTKGGKSTISLDIKGGSINVSSFSLKGGDIVVDLTGPIFIEQDIKTSRLNLKGKVSFSAEMKKMLPVEMFGPADPDTGSYAVELSGRVDRLRKKIGNFIF